MALDVHRFQRGLSCSRLVQAGMNGPEILSASMAVLAGPLPALAVPLPEIALARLAYDRECAPAEQHEMGLGY
jgi:hypothetical protein